MKKIFQGLKSTVVKLNTSEKTNKSIISIIIFIRYPENGKVKTRLALTIGDNYAKEFYKIIAQSIVAEVKRVKNSKIYLFSAEIEATEKIKKWLKGNFLVTNQEGEGLGTRMSNAFLSLFSSGTKKTLLIGTDIPDISKEIIEKASEMLDIYDIVIGPALDGGYYLLGMKKLYNTLFEKIQFSVNTVLSQTILEVEKLGLSYFILPKLQDIDTEEDLKNWLNNGSRSNLKKEINLIYNLINGRVPQRCIHCGE